jgi:hypothetical protein
MRIYQCPACHQTFATEQDFRNHLKRYLPTRNRFERFLHTPIGGRAMLPEDQLPQARPPPAPRADGSGCDRS